MASIHGTITKIIHKGDNYYVLAFDVDHAEPAAHSKKITVAGHLYGLKQLVSGIDIQLVGDWKTHPKYGRQFSMYGWFPWANWDYGVERFLTECVERFDDSQFVGDLVGKLGTLTFDRLTDDPDGVISLYPEGELQRMIATSVTTAWTEARSLNNLSVFLKDYDLSEEVIRNIFHTFGMEAIKLISDNPYQLVAVDGFEFSKADRLAARVGISMNDSRRFDGAVFWVLKSEANQGHVFVRRGDFTDRLKNILLNNDAAVGFDANTLETNLMAAITRLEEQGLLRVDPEAGAYLVEMHLYERDGARKLARFLMPSKLNIDVEAFIQTYEKGNQIELSDAQKSAIKQLIDNHIVAITGLPGTGKTTIVRAVVRLFKQLGVSFLLMAPTGIAAKRLSAVTGEQASTIHRALGWTGKSWEFCASNKFSVGAVIVDETSMVDQELFYRILDALHPTTMLVIVGDDAQLPSVGPGNVLRELLRCHEIPHIRLTQIFRQSAQSDIVLASHQINKGEAPKLDGQGEFQFVHLSDENRIVELIVRMASKLKSRDANFQVLSPKYDGIVGVHNLNQAIREQLNPAVGQVEFKAGKINFREGDRLMVVKNDYKLNVSNGDMGKLISINKDHLLVRIHGVGAGVVDSHVEVPKDRAAVMLRLAYAITVHKSQGSEFDTVILPIVRGQGRMLQRNLFYTAITRAKSKVWLLGEPSAVYRAVGNDRVVQRNTVFARAVTESVKNQTDGVVADVPMVG